MAILARMPRRPSWGRSPPDARPPQKAISAAPIPCERPALVAESICTGAPIEANCLAPFPIENDFFVGRAVVLTRDESGADDRAVFAGRARRLEVQVQGRFRRQVPQGRALFLGAEITKRKMTLSAVTHRMARLLLGLVRGWNPRMHTSFGGDTEAPHIVVPFLTGVDSLVVSRDGDCAPPPTLGVALVDEPEESRARRASSGDDPEALDLGATYTFSFHTSFVSLSRWRVTGLPLGLPELDLRSFWADGDLRLVLYEASDDPVAPHARETNGYLFQCLFRHASNRPAAEDQRGLSIEI